jgi:hypothetical protein
MYHALEEIVEIVATGGTRAIFIQSHQTQISFLIPVFFDNLSAEPYQIVIQDEGCFIPYEVTIVEPPILYGNLVPNSIPEICDGDMDGAFTVEILGGAPYQVSLDNPSGTYTQELLVKQSLILHFRVVLILYSL